METSRAKRAAKCAQAKGTALSKFHGLDHEARKQLEIQAERIILTVQPDAPSFHVREGVFKFMQQQITECFSELPVRPSGAFSC